MNVGVGVGRPWSSRAESYRVFARVIGEDAEGDTGGSGTGGSDTGASDTESSSNDGSTSSGSTSDGATISSSSGGAETRGTQGADTGAPVPDGTDTGALDSTTGAGADGPIDDTGGASDPGRATGSDGTGDDTSTDPGGCGCRTAPTDDRRLSIMLLLVLPIARRSSAPAPARTSGWRR